MTFEQRCTIAQQCLPDAEYRERLAALHNDMLARIAELESALGRDGQKKLNGLLKKGFVVDGVAIARTSDDGTVTRGAVTDGGMVLWWHPNVA